MKIVKTPDKEYAALVQKQIKDNNGYCPCQKEKTPDTKCMCKAFMDQETPGPCHCGLYIKQEV